MKTLSLSLAIGCALAVGFNASAAAAQMFDCKIAQVGWGGWVTDRYVFQVDLAKKQATAIDALINRMNQKPIAARIADANERTIRLKWEIEKVPAMNRATGSSSGNINLAYTAVLNAKKKTVSVRGTVTSGRSAGSSGTSGTGKCKVKQGGRLSSTVAQEQRNDVSRKSYGPGQGFSCDHVYFSRTHFECQ